MQGNRVHAAKSLIFVALLVALLQAALFVLRPAAGTTVPWTSLKSAEGQVDVLALGSSHAHTAIMPMEMWRHAGVTAVNVTSSSQPMPVTLAYLDEAMRSQQPRVVLVEVCMIERPEPIAYRSQTNFDHMPWGSAKLRALVDTAPSDQWLQLMVPLVSYHDRWQELSRGDFNPAKYGQYPFMKGAYYLAESKPLSTASVERTIAEEGYVNDLRYIRDIAKLCREAGVQLILFSAPPVVPVLPDGVPLLDRLRADIQSEYPEAHYVDMNDYVDEAGLNLASDYKDESHVNGPGATKISVWLADYLQGEYRIPDHRSETWSDGWDADLSEYDEFVAGLAGQVE